MTEKITQFRGEYRWLSNFWPVRITYEGVTYPTVEHAYVAAKTLDPLVKVRISKLTTPAEAKRFGRVLKLRDDWDTVKVSVMKELIHEKFKDEALAGKLVGTVGLELEEGNTWGDTFWGVCKGKGKNILGKILMSERLSLVERDFS